MFYKITYNLRLTALTLAAVLSIQSIALAAPDVVSAGVPARDGRSALADYGIPASVAVAGDSFAGSEAGDGSPTFILIEDAHTNPSGQINLSATLDRVIRKHGLTAVLTEGTDRDVSLSELRRYGTARARAAAAMPLVRKGELKGSEFLQLTRDQDFAIVGVEDRGLYDRAVERYAQAAAARRKTSTALERVEAAAHAVAEKLLNPRLARFRAEREKYVSDGVSSADHWASLAVLAQELGIRQADLSQLDRLDRVRKLEKSLDLERVSVEWAQAVAGLPEAEREALSVIEAAAARRNNLESVSAAGARLRKALGDQPVRGALGRYLRYLKAIDGLDPHQLLKQAELLERLVAERLAVTAEEARFVRLDRAIGHLKELADLTLTPSGHAYLEELGEDARLDRVTGFLNRQIMELGIAPERAVLVEQARDAELDAARDFYRIALERDRVIVDRALAVARERGLGTAALITGGFHTRNLTALLRERGIAYQVITPQVYEETDRARYERLLLAHAPERPSASTDTASALITPYTADTPGAVQALTSSFRSLPAEGSSVSEAASGPRSQDRGARMASSSAETSASVVLSSDLVWEAIRAKHGNGFKIRFKPQQKEGEGWSVPLDTEDGLYTRSIWTLVYKFAGPALYTTLLAVLTKLSHGSSDLPKMQLAVIIAFYWQKYIQTDELAEFTRSTVRALGGDDAFREIVTRTISQTVEAADRDPEAEWTDEVERQGLRRVRQKLLFERIEPKAFEFVWGFRMKIYFEEPYLERALAHSFDPRTRYIHPLDGWTSLKQKRRERKREAAEGSGSFERPIPARGRSDTAGARLSEASGTRRLWTVPIPRSIPFARRLVAREVYGRLAGMGASMGLDEPYFKRVISEIFTSCDLRLTYNLTRYQVTERDEESRTVRERQKVKKFLRLVGWQERWYDVWSRESASAPDAAAALRRMSMAEFLGDIGSDESLGRPGVTETMFEQGRTAAYRNLPGMSERRLPAVESLEIPMLGGDPIPARLVRPREALTRPVPVVVIYHGFGMSGSNSYFDELEEKLIAQGIAVLRPDLLSHGRSRRPLGDATEMVRYNNAISAYLRTNRHHLDAGRVGIYGFSFGAYLALRAALESELGNGLGSLVLMNPPTAETFTRHRIYEWHAPLLNELLPAEDFQHLVDKMQGLEWPLLHLIRTLKAGELASIGRKIMLFMSEQDETIDFKDQEMIRRFAGALGVRPVLLKRQGHFPVGAPYRSAIDQAAAHLGRTLNNSGARMADGRPQDLDWFRERILDAVRKNGYARILAVCTANFHRSAAMEWFIGSDAIRRGWNRLAVGSAGTAWWQDEPTLFGSMWGVIPTSVRSSAAETPGAVEGIRTYLRRTDAAEGAGVPGSADLTDREAADLYLRFDPEHWSMPGDIPDDYDPSDWKMMGHVLEQIVWDAEEDLLSSTRLRNGDFKDLTRDVAAQTYPDQSSRENLLTAQEQYGHPKPLTRTALDEADVILIAGEGHRTIIAAASPEALAKTVKLSQLIPTAFNAWIDQGDIPDPGRNEIEEAHLVRALLPASRILLDALAPDGPALSGDDSVQKIRKVRQDLRHVRNLFFKGVHPSDRAIYAQSPTPAGGLDESRLSPVDRFQRMQKRLTENFERVAYHEFEIGRLIDASEVLLRELSERGGSAVRQKDVQFLVRRVIWLRLLLARRMIEKGQFLKARFIWWQVLNARQSGGDAFPDPVYHRVESRVLAFESYRAARTALLRGDLDRADLEVLKMAEWAPDDDPLLGFIRQYREKVRAASAGGPSEPAKVPSEDADPKPFETGHAMAVHDSLTDPGLIYKRSLLDQTDLEVEAMQMALIASRAGFEVRSVGGYWMIEVEGFVPFGMDDGWMVQPRVAPLPSFEDTPEADRDAVLNRVLELDRAFRDRGITHYDLKPNNLARGEDGSLTVLDYGFVFDDPSGARMAVGPAAAVRDTDPDLRVSGPMISLNIRDLGAVSMPLPADAPADAKPFVGVDMMKGLGTARSWLPEFRRQGIGRVYLVGLAASGEMSGLIQSDWREPKNRRPDSLGASGPLFYYGNPANNGVAVQVSAWLKNRKTVDGHRFDNLLGQNVFSVMDPRLIHEGSVPPAAEKDESQRMLTEELRALLREARELGIDVYGDWIPWRAPESVTLTNYKRFFWREPSPEEAADYARAVAEEKKLFPSGHGKRYENTRSRKKLTPTERWIADLLKKAGPFVPVRLPLPDGGEKLVFVRRANIGIDSEDQLVLNPLHPDNIREFIEGLTWLAELGFAGARTDLGFRLLPDFIRPYYEEMREHLSKRGQTLEGWMRESGIRTLREGESFEDWWERQKNTVQPLREIISVVRHRAREMDFVIEAYPYQSHEQKELLALGVDHNYDDSLFKGMLHALRTHSEALPNALRGALARAPHGTVYASNFDEDSLDRLLKKMGRQSAVTGIRLLLATLPRMGVPVLYTERDYLGLEGSAVPMPGGSDPDADSHHPFPAEGEFADRLKPDWAARKIQNAPLPTMLRELEAALGPRTLPSEVWIPGNTNAKNRLVPLFWRDAAGDWYLAIADLYPEWGANTGFGPGRIKIELTASEVPAGLDPSLFTGPLAVHTPQAAWSQSPFWRIGTGDWLSKGSARTLDIDIDHEHYQSFNMVLKLGPGRTTARPETGHPVSIWEPGREPRARERALLKLLAAAPAGDPDAVNALQIALSYPDDNLRAQAANILARRSLVSRSPHIDPADYAGLMMDPFAPYRVAGVQIPRAYLRTYPEPVARQWLVRNGRYSLMHALRHLSLLARGVGEEQVPGDAVYAAGALERFRERLASDAASWESARDAELALEVERAIEETRSVRPSVEWDRDLSAGSPVPANTAELLRLMVLRSQAIARRYPKEYRDTFYWVLEAVREIVPDVKGDPTAEVVWRGRRNAGARMADPTASAAREFLGHFGRTDDGGLILPSGVDRYLAVDVLIKLLHGGDVSYDLAETASDGSTLWRTYRHDGLTGLERVTDGTAELRNEVRGAIEALGMDPDRLRRLVEDPEFKNPFLETFDDRIRAAAAADAAASGLEAPDPEAEERFRRVDTIFQPAIRSRVRGTERDIFFVRVVHNRDRAVETKGPGKGGIRFVFSNFLNNDAEFMGRFERLAGEGFGLEELRFFLRKWLREEALALSVGMTIKAAVADLPYGGAKGVLLRADVHPDPSGGFTVLDDIPTDPAAGPLKRSLALGERDQVLRSAARSLWEAGRVGPRIDVPAPDVGSTPFNMNILTDELIRARFLKDRRSGALAEYPEGLAELLDRIEPTGGPVYSPTLNRYLAAVVEWRASNPSVPVDPDSIAVLPASFTAKTVQMGGSVFRTESTGYGAQLITREIVRRLKGNVMTAGERPTAKIEGLGNVGYHLADSAVRFDAYRVQWIAEMRGVFYKEAGFTSEDLVRLRAFLSDPEARPQDLAFGSSPYFIEDVRTFPQNRGVMESFWSAPADVLYLAAKESSLTAENISSVRGTVIVEAANGAVTSAAARALAGDPDRVHVPDVLANAGGVTVSYLEWLQNLSGERWNEDRVRRELDGILLEAARKVFALRSELELNSGKPVDLATAADVLAYRAVREAAERNDSAKGARMADGADAGEGPTLAYRRTRLEAENGLHSRPSASIFTTFDIAQSDAEWYGQKLWMRVYRVRGDGTVDRSAFASIDSILELLALGVTDGTELHLEAGGTVRPEQAEALVGIFADLLSDRRTLSHGINHRQEERKEYWARIHHVFDPGLNPLPERLSQNLRLRYSRIERFLESVAFANRGLDRAHVAVERDDRTVAVFRIWREGGNVWYALKGQAGRIRIEPVGPELPPDLPAYTPVVEEEADAYAEALQPHQAVALELALADELVGSVGNFIGADSGRSTLRANVELDAQDLVRRSGYDLGDLLPRLRAVQERVREQGLGRLILADGDERLPGARTVRLAHEKNAAYRATAGPDTTVWSYLQEDSQILPILSSTILSALLAAAPEEGKEAYLLALTPLYQKLTGSEETLTPALLDEARNDPARLTPIKPLTLRGYLDVAVYLQELARGATAKSA